MGSKFSMTVIVITPERVNVTAIGAGGVRISEEYGKTPAGKLDHISGNFEEEPALSDGLLEALSCLQGPAMAVLEELAA